MELVSPLPGGRPNTVPEPRLLEGGASALLTYEPYFGLRDKAFSLSADPRFLYKSGSHAPAFDDLLSGIRRREGLVVLTGEIGTGKTTLCRAVLEHLDRKTFSAFVPDPFVSREDLLKMLLIDFGVMSVEDLKTGRLKDASRPDLSYPLYEFLNSLVPLQAFAVLIIDEAQNLSLPLLEEIRILADLEGREKLLQVVLVGQLELLTKLKLPQMRQLDQRVSVRCTLAPLNRAEVAGYIAHRLQIAGGGRDRVEIPPEAFDVIYRGSGGVPRLINRICDRALHRAHVQRTTRVVPEIVLQAIADLGLDAAPAPEAPVEVRQAEPDTGEIRPREMPLHGNPPRESAVQEIPLQAGDSTRRGLFGQCGPRVDASPPEMDLSGLLEMAAAADLSETEPARAGDLPGEPEPAPQASVQRTSAEPSVPIPGGVLGLGRADEGYVERRWTRHRHHDRFSVARVLKMALAAVGIWALVAALWGFWVVANRLAEEPTVLYLPPPAVAPAPLSLGERLSLAGVRPAAAVPMAAPALPATTAVSSGTPAAGGPSAYIVQVALFASNERANRSLEQLTQAGFRAYLGELIIGTSRLRQVLVGPYGTRAEAELDRGRIRLIPDYSDARVAVAAPQPPAAPSR